MINKVKSVIPFLFVALLLPCSAQVSTFFGGKQPVFSQTNPETGALYSVEIRESYDAKTLEESDYTLVTVELIPTKNRRRMNLWSSRNTYIVVDGYVFPIKGFFKDKVGKTTFWHTDPFNGHWGWTFVKKGKKYYYSMLFDGYVPPGLTQFNLVDEGTSDGSHGYCFRNYTINNPHKFATAWTFDSIMTFLSTTNDAFCGIYESNEWRLACVKDSDAYDLIFLGCIKPMSWWKEGDMKAQLRPTAAPGLYRAVWARDNKKLTPDCTILFDGLSMKVNAMGKEQFFIKMYPQYAVGEEPSEPPLTWSGTGFALNNGFVATNYHVVDGAEEIIVRMTDADGLDEQYAARVITTDKNNDLAIIKITDSRFEGFGEIPYRIKTQSSDVGEDCFVLGYPRPDDMGEEVKLTTGVISSNSGFQGDATLYQTSATVHPGNSGGPLFDGKGNLIGIVCAKLRGAENVSYAIKTPYLEGLAQSASSSRLLPSNNAISNLELPEKVKWLRKFVFQINCSRKG